MRDTGAWCAENHLNIPMIVDIFNAVAPFAIFMGLLMLLEKLPSVL